MTRRALLMAPLAAAAARAQDREAELRRVARVATVMMDGDECKRVVTPRALAAMFAENPKDKWAASDDYNVDAPTFIRVKKTLIRLSRLAPFPCDVNLWLPLAAKPGKVHIAIRNANELSQFWTWGALHQDAHPAMKTVLETGGIQAVSEKPGLTSVLAPVYDSLGAVVGLVEVVARSKPDTHENVR
ncbi:MAG: hypothetical protein R2762_00500 [Bryobacteraceae bacterium]